MAEATVREQPVPVVDPFFRRLENALPEDLIFGEAPTEDLWPKYPGGTTPKKLEAVLASKPTRMTQTMSTAWKIG